MTSQDAARRLILVVDDERPIVELIAAYLDREGFRVSACYDGRRAVAAVQDLSPDVVILDVMLPGLDGIEVCREIRAFSDVCILMLTARGEEVDTVLGLTVGADDYLAKPFSPREVVARVKALLRRQRVPGQQVVRPIRTPDGMEIDPARHRLRVDGTAIDVTALEFKLLAALAATPGVVLTRAQLLERVWGAEFTSDDHLVDVHVAKLRRKLGDDPTRPRFVETVRGVGYRLREDAH
jgi:DNA-binding response OmpR family regulator